MSTGNSEDHNESRLFTAAQASMRRSFQAVIKLTQVSLNAPAISAEYKTAARHDGADVCCISFPNVCVRKESEWPHCLTVI